MSGAWLGAILGGVTGLWVIYAHSKFRDWKKTALFTVILLSLAAVCSYTDYPLLAILQWIKETI
jgi:hypothetical protein